LADNPLIGTATRCFACGPENPIGLKIAFRIEHGVCMGRFTPGKYHVGFNDTVHGGIIFSALDDVMANLLYLQGIKAYTAKCEIRYRQPLRVGQAIDLTARIESERRRLVSLKGEARLAGSGDLIADTSAAFMLE
jgi:acyl-coenzyme A thioesterase PaaI-like protein